MITYREFSPTPFDHAGAFLPERHEWFVAPVSITRDTDSGDRDMSNFRVLEKELDEMDPEFEDHENHSFNHWGPGWFEIILVRPGSDCCSRVEETERALEDYPVLDEEDLSEREHDSACRSWEWLSMKERMETCARQNVSVFAARRNDLPCGIEYEMHSDGVYFR